ncbi:hypothetical protein KL949_000819 [Ogataea haglerorum]|nr:hypothetical protein KL913_000823 [Ogataea haglerorum]KAG7721841.1 hypothetical protein KL949_000819 [Ogataea haglerorum]KAG7744302.1 hypothetical protein KL932_000818 [Ogataea haglerorum]KAG7770170.1 hypothetical protein KL931_001934 [Ogataea haglerorum]KAG7812615.1 hypothetical protein KL924_001363 [Ogataea haglerorum]
MMNPKHVYNMNDKKTTSVTPYMRFEPVEYDPQVDPTNMDQYKPKMYKVEPVYQKVNVDEKSGHDTYKEDELADEPPRYSELYDVKDDSAGKQRAGRFRRALAGLVLLIISCMLAFSMFAPFRCPMETGAAVNKGNIALVVYEKAHLPVDDGPSFEVYHLEMVELN